MSHVMWSPGMNLRDTEEQIVKQAFAFYGKNKTATANSLGINVRTLEHKLQKYAEQQSAHEERVRNEQLGRDKFLQRCREGSGATPPASEIQAPDESPSTGVRVEPAKAIRAQQPMPLPEREEIQELLPQDVASSGN